MALMDGSPMPDQLSQMRAISENDGVTIGQNGKRKGEMGDYQQKRSRKKTERKPKEEKEKFEGTREKVKANGRLEDRHMEKIE